MTEPMMDDTQVLKHLVGTLDIAAHTGSVGHPDRRTIAADYSWWHVDDDDEVGVAVWARLWELEA